MVLTLLRGAEGWIRVITLLMEAILCWWPGGQVRKVQNPNMNLLPDQCVHIDSLAKAHLNLTIGANNYGQEAKPSLATKLTTK